MDSPELSPKELERRRKISESKKGKRARIDPLKEAERRRKISEAKRGKPRPDLAERNRSEAMRSLPREISDEARERMAVERTTHGHARSRTTGRAGTSTYYIWAAMIQRCTNPRCAAWKDYGGRGISVCARWRESFENFLADMGEKPEGLSIDRTNNDGNYEPGNCRWATASEQARNKRPRGTAS
jgi:hypothetical protein